MMMMLLLLLLLFSLLNKQIITVLWCCKMDQEWDNKELSWISDAREGDYLIISHCKGKSPLSVSLVVSCLLAPLLKSLSCS